MGLVTMNTDLKQCWSSCSMSGTEDNALHCDQRSHISDIFLDTHVNPDLDEVESVVVAAKSESWVVLVVTSLSTIVVGGTEARSIRRDGQRR